jgi:hypothetical protein
MVCDMLSRAGLIPCEMPFWLAFWYIDIAYYATFPYVESDCDSGSQHMFKRPLILAVLICGYLVGCGNSQRAFAMQMVEVQQGEQGAVFGTDDHGTKG